MVRVHKLFLFPLYTVKKFESVDLAWTSKLRIENGVSSDF